MTSMHNYRTGNNYRSRPHALIKFFVSQKAYWQTCDIEVFIAYTRKASRTQSWTACKYWICFCVLETSYEGCRKKNWLVFMSQESQIAASAFFKHVYTLRCTLPQLGHEVCYSYRCEMSLHSMACLYPSSFSFLDRGRLPAASIILWWLPDYHQSAGRTLMLALLCCFEPY